MNSIQSLTSPDVKLEKWLNQNPIRNGLLLYNITTGFNLVDWLVAYRADQIQACFSFYKGTALPSLISRGTPGSIKQLIKHVKHSQFFAIIPKSHRKILEEFYQFQNPGEFHLMWIEKNDFPTSFRSLVERLSISNLEEVKSFYKKHGAGAWHPKQLEFGSFYCIRKGGSIVSICGTIGVYPKSPGVAVLGNLITVPDNRQCGYGTAVIWAVVNELFQQYHYVTLLVESDNKIAIRLYERLGFCFYESFDTGICTSENKRSA